MKSIELPVLFNTDETTILVKAGIDHLYKDCEIKNVCFFNIDYAMKIIDDDGLEYTKIGVNGDSFIVNMKYNEFVDYIDLNKN